MAVAGQLLAAFTGSRPGDGRLDEVSIQIRDQLRLCAHIDRVFDAEKPVFTRLVALLQTWDGCRSGHGRGCDPEVRAIVRMLRNLDVNQGDEP